MINLPKISLQIVPDQIALYLASDCSGCAQTFPIQCDSGASRVYTDNAKRVLSIYCEQCNYNYRFIIPAFFFRKKGYINFVSKLVCRPSVRAYVRPLRFL